MSRIIRASMLPAWPDCPRRAAARQFKELIGSAGFQLRKLLPSIGAAVGTAVHAETTAALRSRMETGTTVINVDETRRVFREEITEGVEWDPTTPNSAAAEQQIARMANELRKSPATQGETIAVEESLRAEIAEGWIVTGHIDHVRAMPEGGHHVDDWKTGAVRRPYSAQIGCYAMIADANGYNVRSAATTYVPRVALKKVQPPAEFHPEDLAMTKRAAWETSHEIIRTVGAFEQSGDPFAFQANPMSLMCSDKYCPAHSTRFCTLHLTKEKRP